MTDIKWSAFPSTTSTTSGDTVVGIHGGVNEQFIMSPIPTALAIALWDANNNLNANNYISGYQSISTTGGTTTLTVSSPFITSFNGTSGEVCIMPVVSTLQLGQPYRIINNSSSDIAVQSSGISLIQMMLPGTYLDLFVQSIIGTGAASWQIVHYDTLVNTYPLSLIKGGTGNNLTASSGGIVWSDSSKMNILSGTTTPNQLLLSGNDTTPSWSTSTYPSTNAINTLLYASAANTMAALATSDNATLQTSSTGVPQWLANSSTAGYILTANSGAPPSWNAISTNNTYTPALSIGGSSTGITYTTQSGYYTQVGNIITFNIYLALSSIGGLTGIVTINNALPSNLRTGPGESIFPIYLSNAGVGASTNAPYIMGVSSGTTTGNCLNQTTTSGYTFMTDTALTNTGMITISGSYLI